jgi:hypothetical protein
MSRILEKVALALLSAGFCSGESLTPDEALDRYLTRSRDGQPGCSDSVFSIQIDASLPKLDKQSSMTGFKLVSRTGRIVYRGLRFTGDNLVKTALIERFLANDAKPPERDAGAGITRQNYSFTYETPSDYNGLMAYVFRLKPKRKRVGLLKGELWLEASTAAPLRLWGDFVKSPSFFIRSFRLVQDYQRIDQCSQPLRLLVTVQTRTAGEADIAVWLHSLAGEPATTGGTEGSDGVATPDLGH